MSPKTVFEDVEKLQPVRLAYEPRVKQIVRKLDPIAAGTIDGELSSWVNNGWKLSFVQRIATEPDGHTILYVFTKD